MLAPGIEHFPGVGHSDELYLQWHNVQNVDRPLNREDAEMSLSMTTMWTNFVKYGNPTPDDHNLSFKWNPANIEKKEYLVIDQQTKMDLDKDYLRRMAFWDSIWPQDKPF